VGVDGGHACLYGAMREADAPNRTGS